MNKFNIKSFLFLIVFAVGCGGSSGSPVAELVFSKAVSFDANETHGQIDYFKVIVESEDLENNIVMEFDGSSESALIDNLPKDINLSVTVDAVNYRGFTILRGRSGEFLLSGGETTQVPVEVNVVPVFTNILENSRVYANRFVPRVYAPGEVEFQILDNHESNEEEVLPSISSGDASFSISDDVEGSISPIFIKELSPGVHNLKVMDVANGEYTIVQIEVLDPEEVILLDSTAGDYFGSRFNEDPFYNDLSLVKYLERLVS